MSIAPLLLRPGLILSSLVSEQPTSQRIFGIKKKVTKNNRQKIKSYYSDYKQGIFHSESNDPLEKVDLKECCKLKVAPEISALSE